MRQYLSNGGYSDVVPQKYALMLKNEIGCLLEPIDPEGAREKGYTEYYTDALIYYRHITWAEVFD